MANDNEESGTATEAAPAYKKRYRGEFDVPELCNKCVPIIGDDDCDRGDTIDLEEEALIDMDSINWEEIADGVRSKNHMVKLHAIYWIRRLLSHCPNPPIPQIVNTGIVPELVKCLKYHDDASLQMESAWALTNIVSGNSIQTNAVVSAGAIPLFINLLYSPVQNICEQAVWALANIIGDGPELKEQVMKLGILHPLLSLMRPDSSTTFLRNATWVLVNLCRFPPPPRGIMPALSLLLDQTDKNILYYTIWALNFLANSGKDRVQLMYHFRIMERLIALLGHSDAKIVSTASKAVETIILQSDEDKFPIYKEALKYYPDLLVHSNEMVVTEANYFMLNTTMNNSRNVQAAIEANVLPSLVKQLNDEDFELQVDSAKVIYNMTYSGNNDNIASIIDAGVLKPLCSLLECKDPQVVYFVLVTFGRMFKKYDPEKLAEKIEACGGLEKLEALLNHETESVFNLADAIIDNYFTRDDDSDEEEEDDNAESDLESVHDSAHSSIMSDSPNDSASSTPVPDESHDSAYSSPAPASPAPDN